MRAHSAPGLSAAVFSSANQLWAVDIDRPRSHLANLTSSASWWIYTSHAAIAPGVTPNGLSCSYLRRSQSALQPAQYRVRKTHRVVCHIHQTHVFL